MSRRVLSWALLCALAACSAPPAKAPPGVPDFCQPSGQLTMLAETNGYLDTRPTVHAAGRFQSCDGGPLAAFEVEARLTGPDGKSRPVQLSVRSEPYADPDGGFAFLFGPVPFDGGTLVRADATFDIDSLGLYGLMLKFKPGLGTLQTQVIGMEDRRGNGPIGLSTPLGCSGFDLWDDALICTPMFAQLVVMPNGQPPVQLPVDSFTLSDAGMWTVDTPGDTLSLWALRDGGPVKLAQAGLPVGFDGGWFPGQGPPLAASGNQVLIATPMESLLARYENGALAVESKGATPQPLFYPLAVALRARQGALLAEQNFGPMTAGVCLLNFVDGGASCRDDVFALGSDDGVLWVTSSAGELTALELADGPTVVEHRAIFRQGIPTVPDFSQSALPFEVTTFSSITTLGMPFAPGPFPIGTTVRLPRLKDGEPVVAGYGEWAFEPQTGATPRCFWSYDPFTSVLRYLPR